MSFTDLLIEDMAQEILRAESDRDRAVATILAYRESLQVLLVLYSNLLTERDVLRRRLRQTLGIDPWHEDDGPTDES